MVFLIKIKNNLEFEYGKKTDRLIIKDNVFFQHSNWDAKHGHKTKISMIFMKIMQTIIFNACGPTGLSQLGSSQFNNKPESLTGSS